MRPCGWQLDSDSDSNSVPHTNATAVRRQIQEATTGWFVSDRQESCPPLRRERHHLESPGESGRPKLEGTTRPDPKLRQKTGRSYSRSLGEGQVYCLGRNNRSHVRGLLYPPDVGSAWRRSRARCGQKTRQIF